MLMSHTLDLYCASIRHHVQDGVLLSIDMSLYCTISFLRMISSILSTVATVIASLSGLLSILLLITLIIIVCVTSFSQLSRYLSTHDVGNMQTYGQFSMMPGMYVYTPCIVLSIVSGSSTDHQYSTASIMLILLSRQVKS